MKHLLRALLGLLLIAGTAYGQKQLSTSRTSGIYTYIYKLTDAETFLLAIKGKNVIDHSFLHSVVDSFYTDHKAGYTKKLPYGNYLLVKAVKNKLEYQLQQEQNVALRFVNDGKTFQLAVTDPKGNRVNGAIVTAGKHQRITYDAALGLYVRSNPPGSPVLQVNYKGINNYFVAQQPIIEKPYRRQKRAYTYAQVKIDKPDYLGYLVFNKPMYKPLDTVKFKAYLVDKNGRELRDIPLRVDIEEDDVYRNRSKNDEDDEDENLLKTLTTLKPYRAGGYTYDFVLADTLDLDLDERYYISLKVKNGKRWKEVYGSSFRYEDYELKSLNFAVRTDKEIHRPGNPVTVYLKATDENELAIPDGRVEVIAEGGSVSKYHQPRVFVKDELWKTTLKLDPVGETKLVLPDSIFPKADLSFTLRFTLFNSNNESKTTEKYLKYFAETRELKSDLRKDSLHFDYQVAGKSVKQQAKIYLDYGTSTEKDVMQVSLPVTLPVNIQAQHYLIKTADGFSETVDISTLKPALAITAVPSRDSLRIAVVNEHRVPFWYTIFSGNSVVAKGYTKQLDTLMRSSSGRATFIRINYYWAGKEYTDENAAVYRPQYLNVKLLGPEIVYPGQAVNMQVKVTDAENKPVTNTDVTAYAFTSKFKEQPQVLLPDFGKEFSNRKTQPSQQLGQLNINGNLLLDWHKWGKVMGLDTIAYYHFMQTKDLYAIREDSKDSLTLVAPFLVKNGAIEPVNIVYIDDVPVYFDQANQIKTYAFPVSPGRHRISLRSYFHRAEIEYDFEKGKKTILSLAAEVSNPRAKVVQVMPQLLEYEAIALNQYMLRITNNFKGQKTLLKTDERVVLLNKPVAHTTNAELLVGPFKENYLNYTSGNIDVNFIKEPGFTYTFLPGLLKQKSYTGEYAFKAFMAMDANEENINYQQYPLSVKDINALWDDALNLRSRQEDLFYNPQDYRSNDLVGELSMELDTALANKLPYVKNILLYKLNEPDFIRIYRGNMNRTLGLESGNYKVMYLFKDNRYFISDPFEIKAKGTNYLLWDKVNIQPADTMSTRIDNNIKSTKSGWEYHEANENNKLDIRTELSIKDFDLVSFKQTMTGRVVDKKNLSPLPGVSVKLKGTNYGVFTDFNGYFKIKIPEYGKLQLFYIGYKQQTIEAKAGNIGDVRIEEEDLRLEEVVVVGYGVQKKTSLTGSLARITSSLMGTVAGVSISSAPGASAKLLIRGISTMKPTEKPLVIIDGLPFSGDLSSLDTDLVVEMNILKGDEAVSLYGASAANGVVIIKTKGGNMGVNADGVLEPQQQTLRTRFSDYAIWQPTLLTDENGKASFTVRFPDDITKWTTRIIAMNGRKQGGWIETAIKSFKTLSANFVSPQFAVTGDRMQVMGKLMNYTHAEETAIRKFSYNDKTLLDGQVKFKNAKLDSITIVAAELPGQDSLKFEYTMKQDNGYFDGEIRKIPLLQAGVTETKGYFNALNRDTTLMYQFDPKLGKVTVRAEASVFPVLLDEMEKLRRYEYLCNEQLASKLKGLLLEKTVRQYLNEPFKEEKNIKELIKKLQQNRRSEGTWGWWKSSGEESWISLHATEALLLAEQQGYEKALIDKDKLYRYLIAQNTDNKNFNQIYRIRLLHLLDAKYYLKDWVVEFEKDRAVKIKSGESNKPTLYEQLQLMQLKQEAGMPVDLNWMLGQKRSTMFGNTYWGEQQTRFWDNSIQSTLLAYRILRTAGGHTEMLNSISRYFLEQRKSGQWRNTYESSLILETILPELLIPGKKAEPAAIVLNKTEKVTVFPFEKILQAEKLEIAKQGSNPVYLTAYQQFNNPEPVRVSKDFTVTTSFSQDGVKVQQLTAGKKVLLMVDVEARADGDYVMIEIPVPAGCSYENKLQRFWGVENHREYFKHKTSIFCQKLKQGKHHFEIELMPRYSGDYVLNPAKAELMYFPVFYGREGIKRIVVKAAL